MAKQLYLIKLGEISLKGQNRVLFEKRLRHNIKEKLRPYQSNCVKQKGRLFFYIQEDCPKEVIEKALSTTFGVVGYAKAIVTEKKVDHIVEAAKKLLATATVKENGTFKINTKRADKGFELSSYDLSCLLAVHVHEAFPSLTVDLKNPDFVLNLEVRNNAYLYTSSSSGPSGLPVGIAGRGLLLLSGGIDSPVAAIEMAKRGLKMDCLYFHAYPYTSNEAKEKVKKLASLIAPYLNGTRLFIANFTKQQIHIRDNAYEEETTLMFRAAMMKTAEKVCEEQNLNSIITGEALSQVASQTLTAMDFTNSMTDYLVARPLIGRDKEEIIQISKRINTYETSILPFEDCCVIFSPKHPITNPVKSTMKKHYEALDMQDMILEAVKECEVIHFNAKGEELTPISAKVEE